MLIVFAALCLLATPAMADLMVSVQPVTLNSGAVVPGTTTLELKVGDVVGFQIFSQVSIPGDSGFANMKASLTQLLATVAGTWNTQVMGTISPVAITGTGAGTGYQGSGFHAGAINQDVNGDGFALDVGSTATTATNYINPVWNNIVSHGPVSDVLGAFTYTVTDVNAASQIPTVLNLKFATNGATNGKAAWFEAGVQKTSAVAGAVYGPGPAINLTAAPVPEPSTLILLGMGALALLAIRRRK